MDYGGLEGVFSFPNKGFDETLWHWQGWYEVNGNPFTALSLCPFPSQS
jgi:hypothetical protein